MTLCCGSTFTDSVSDPASQYNLCFISEKYQQSLQHGVYDRRCACLVYRSKRRDECLQGAVESPTYRTSALSDVVIVYQISNHNLTSIFHLRMIGDHQTCEVLQATVIMQKLISASTRSPVPKYPNLPTR